MGMYSWCVCVLGSFLLVFSFWSSVLDCCCCLFELFTKLLFPCSKNTEMIMTFFKSVYNAIERAIKL